MTPTQQTLPKAVMSNGQWVTRPYVLTKSDKGLSDKPVQPANEQDTTNHE